MLINCAVGEKGVADKQNDALMHHIDIAAIASGAHAGDKESITYYKDLANELGVKIAAYLSYPNKASLESEASVITSEQLMASLQDQLELFGDVTCVKFQGPLYQYLNRSAQQAEVVVRWLKEVGIKEVIAPYRSMMHKMCSEFKLACLYEAYADRAYQQMRVDLELTPQNQLGDTLNTLEDIVRQVRKLKNGVVEVNKQNYLIEAETICLDGSVEDAIEKIEAIKAIL